MAGDKSEQILFKKKISKDNIWGDFRALNAHIEQQKESLKNRISLFHSEGH